MNIMRTIAIIIYMDIKEYKYAAKYAEKSNWLLNVSMLVPLKELKSLNLSANAIAGCLPNEGMFSPAPSAFRFSYIKKQRIIL
jgi:hypothetical protein